ncbi:S9 family peptidase [Cellulosimicrobium cellulans]|uniref:S9 family peptidase n=1 Tax=Cellulosimicrobium cellulans TaxID=1710 RepID=A0A1Y0HUA8_CELCE|nr:prolyl oligopeptidase family serine peptidase [Cellulosimicrobium cellulans]ARU51757.1 S9 family peptidase [Cellulosimicrobium cellulans]
MSNDAATPGISGPSETPFHDLDHYLAIPRVGGLALSPDGARLVTTVQTLDPQRTGYRTALWEVDPAGEAPARRLTRSTKGESSATFTGAGDVLFTSARPDPDGGSDDDPKAALWLLPAGGGEARVVATAPAGVSGPLAATDAPVVSVAASVLPSARDLAHDAELRSARKDAKVAAILHSAYPVRQWDHDRGPDEAHRFVGDLTALVDEPAHPLPDPAGSSAEDAGREAAAHDPRLLDLHDVTRGVGQGSAPGRALHDHSADLSADGTTLVTTWQVAGPGPQVRNTLVAIDTATGARRTLVDEPSAEAHWPRISPDGAWVAFVRETISTPHQAPEESLAVVPLHAPDGPAGVSTADVPAVHDDSATTRAENHATPRTLVPHWDRWPTSLRWLPDGSGLLVTADDDGRGPVFLVAFSPDGATENGTAERVTSDDAVFTDVQVAPDGRTAYALRTSYLEPSHPVRIDVGAFLGSGEAGSRTPVPATPLRGPVATPDLPGTLVDVETAAADDVRVRGWLALPHGASAENPAPLLLWIHGGPLGSWNAWSWRWNPWLMVARGYAVLLPDPALSTGYGQDFVQRGWGAWGKAPYTDLLAITDAVEARPEVDASRTAAMGGSFGGYMANWVAGHTDRFRAIVTHASLWALDQFGPTTDHAYYWAREMTPEMALDNSPHRFVGDIVTPMLVIHGDKDYRVPIGEGLRLWYELLESSGLPAGADGETVHRFLFYPDENHWVLQPQHAKVWYQVVHAFLAEHVLGATPGEGDAELPTTLG